MGWHGQGAQSKAWSSVCGWPWAEAGWGSRLRDPGGCVLSEQFSGPGWGSGENTWDPETEAQQLWARLQDGGGWQGKGRDANLPLPR